MTILHSERNRPPIRENVGTSVNTSADLASAVSLFHGLSDPTRLAIIRYLSVPYRKTRPGSVNHFRSSNLSSRLRSRYL